MRSFRTSFYRWPIDGAGLPGLAGFSPNIMVSPIEADVPVLTSLSPASEAAWRAFATQFFVTLPADVAEIDAWWQRVRSNVRVGA